MARRPALGHAGRPSLLLLRQRRRHPGLSARHPSGETTELRFVMALGGREPPPQGKARPGDGARPMDLDRQPTATCDSIPPRSVVQEAGPGPTGLVRHERRRAGQHLLLRPQHPVRSGCSRSVRPQRRRKSGLRLVPGPRGRAGRHHRGKVLPAHGRSHGEGRDLYAFGRSDLFPPYPGSGPAWMGGWALASSTRPADVSGSRGCRSTARAWTTCPATAAWSWATLPRPIIYHYNRDGLLRGFGPAGRPPGNVSGWLDNTASIACNRDPATGCIDVFAEEDYAHRILWYRLRRCQDRGEETADRQIVLQETRRSGWWDSFHSAHPTQLSAPDMTRLTRDHVSSHFLFFSRRHHA